MNGVSFCDHSYTNLDFVDDVCLLAELLELLVPVLEALATEAESGVRGQLAESDDAGFRQHSRCPPSITVLEQKVSTVEEFVYLDALIHSPSHSFPDILSRCAFTRTSMQSIDKQLWRSRISLLTTLRLYNTCILLIYLHGSECWAITKEDARRINAFHQWCLHMLLGIKWYHFISNDDQPTYTHGNYPGTASNPIRAYCPNRRQCRRKADIDFLDFYVLEETTRTTADDLDEDGAERPGLPRAVMDRRSRPGPEPTTLEAAGN